MKLVVEFYEFSSDPMYIYITLFDHFISTIYSDEPYVSIVHTYSYIH